MEDVGPGEQEPPARTFGVASRYDLLGPLSNLIRRNYAKSTKKRTFEKVRPGKKIPEALPACGLGDNLQGQTRFLIWPACNLSPG